MNLDLYVILKRVPFPYPGVFSNMEKLFLLGENSGGRINMDNLICNGHISQYKLRVSIRIRPLPNNDVPVEQRLPLLVTSHQAKAQALKLIDMIVHKQIEQ